MSATTTLSPPAPRARRRIGKKLTAVMLAGLVVTGGAVVFDTSAPAAQAVTNGARITAAGTTTIGNWIAQNGKRTYCVEIFKDLPTDGTASNDVTSLPASAVTDYWAADLGVQVGQSGQGALSGHDFKVFRYVIDKFGETADADQAASVQLAIWKIRGSTGTGGYHEILNGWVKALPSHSATADGYIAEANAWLNAGGDFSGSGSGAPTGNPTFLPNVQNPYVGQIDVPESTTELKLTNGIFTSSGNASISFPGGAAAGTKVSYQGIPPTAETWDRYYTITLNGKYRFESWGLPGCEFLSGYSSQSHCWPGEHVEKSGNFEAQLVDPDTLWAPELSTETPSKVVGEGEKFADTVTFYPSKAGSGIWRWAQNSKGEKRYAPIKATGTLYGPFLQDPALNPAGAPPNGAPVAATAEITTDSGRDHSQPQTYEVKTDAVSEEAGFYTWVWNIDSKDQEASVTGAARNMLPANYFFTDGYGQATEGQHSPTQVRLTTELSTDSVSIGDSFTDTLNVTLAKGGWLQGDDGKRLPFTITGTAYLSEEKPAQTPTAPEGAEVLGTVTATTSSPEETIVSDPIYVPLSAKGNFVTMQWCFSPENQPAASAGKVEAWCDDYGVAAETAEIVRPEVSTTAQVTGTVRGDVQDTAIVTGGMPDLPASIDFTAYLKPEAGEPKYDENWKAVVEQKPVLDEDGKPVLDEDGEPTFEEVPVLWTEDEVSDPDAVCEAQPVAHTDRVNVNGVGQYESPAVRAETEGTLYWVEELFVVDPETDEEVSLHRGKCGLPNETTEIEKPVVTTKAVDEAFPGDEIWDTAIVEGPLSEREEISYEVTFEAFHREKGETTEVNEELCTTDTKVRETDEPTKVSEEGEYLSEKWKVNTKHVGEILWVETLWQVEKTDEGENRYELHRGKCGEKDEITRVVKPAATIAVINTGTDNGLLIGGIAGGVLVLAGLAIAFIVRGRRKAASTDNTSIDQGELSDEGVDSELV
ncbi:hypothetical protein EDF62_3256 [Leucobacter luti]|uniref:Uncharacterized protein n=1 Tax=Leucobacter luti TaxID=340320 RepID=A0A4R6RTC7_9MICO|nr:hypothetical protein [Leucobacter luti]TDP89525.1 hypothetical protein EDF62_3256 [Leucobacter luti]